jgi:tetratricopeptide (TPR) repeat protein
MKHIGSVLSLSMFFAVLLLPSLPGAEEDVAVAIYRDGLKKYVLGDYGGAVEDFDRALTQKPEDELIKKMYITTLLKSGNREYDTGVLIKAERLFTKAYTLSGEDENLRKNVTMILERITAGKDEAALRGAGTQHTADETAAGSGEGGGGPERVELVLPFAADELMQQQNQENQKKFDRIMEAQKLEREKLFQRIAEGQQSFEESVKSQSAERERLFRNMENSRKLIYHDNTEGYLV